MGLLEFPDRPERGLHRTFPRALLAFALTAGGVAAAQTAPPSGASAVEAVQQRDKELENLRADQKKANEAARKLDDDAQAVGEDRRKLNQTLIDTATRIRQVEDRIAATETRLKPLDESERTLRGSLEGRREAISKILAALQRIGHRPPPAVFVRPDSALEQLRTAMMLGAILPDMRHDAQAIAEDLSGLMRVRKDIAGERERLTSDLATLSGDRQRMTALIDERQRRQGELEKSRDDERQRAAALGRQAESLKDLIAKLEQGMDPSMRAARQAGRAPDDLKSGLAALKDPGRLNPAINFSAAKGMLKLPVSGTKTRDFGASDGLGGTEKGISVVTRAGAQVTAPCDGWVAYAAPYRSYGQLLILNPGDGYLVLMAGMDHNSVEVGQFVLTGEPIAVMGSGPQVASAILTGSSQPVLYIEFRKDGAPVDPAPWWATSGNVTSGNEKVRG
jgi:septal ring factor EnvC (AmiA/AmiB activator)